MIDMTNINEKCDKNVTDNLRIDWNGANDVYANAERLRRTKRHF